MCCLYIVMLQNPGLWGMCVHCHVTLPRARAWFVHCHVTESRVSVCAVCTLPYTEHRARPKGICLYIALLHYPGLEYVWFVYCHVTEPRARVCAACSLPCCII